MSLNINVDKKPQRLFLAFFLMHYPRSDPTAKINHWLGHPPFCIELPNLLRRYFGIVETIRWGLLILPLFLLICAHTSLTAKPLKKRALTTADRYYTLTFLLQINRLVLVIGRLFMIFPEYFSPYFLGRPLPEYFEGSLYKAVSIRTWPIVW